MINKELKNYSKKNNIDLKLLTIIYEKYSFSKTFDINILKNIKDQQHFSKLKYLERRQFEKDFIDSLKSFISNLCEKNKPNFQVIKNKKILSFEEKNRIEKIKKEMKETEVISKENWNNYKKQHLATKEYTKEEIINILKNKTFVKKSFRFDDFKIFTKNIFYHGTKSPDLINRNKLLLPSIAFDDNYELGGGYDKKHFGISVSTDKKIAAEFSELVDGKQEGTVYTILLSSDANVVDLKNIEDAADIEDIITELYKYSVDAIFTNSTEKEIIILNPRAIKIIDTSIINRESYLKRSITNSTQDELKNIYDKKFKTLDSIVNIKKEKIKELNKSNLKNKDTLKLER